MKKSTQLTTSELFAWDFLESHHALVLQKNLTELAAYAYVSTASSIRAVQKKGFSGFADYKNFLKNQQKNEHSASLFSPTAQRFINKNLEEVVQTLALLDIDTMESAISLLNQAKSIMVVSQGPTTSVAELMINKFRSLDKVAFAYSDPDYMLLFSKRLTNDDLLLAISLRGETAAINETVKQAKKNKCKVLALTTVFESELARLADTTVFSHRTTLKNIEQKEDMSSRMPLEISSRILLNLYEIMQEEGSIRK